MISLRASRKLIPTHDPDSPACRSAAERFVQRAEGVTLDRIFKAFKQAWGADGDPPTFDNDSAALENT